MVKGKDRSRILLLEVELDLAMNVEVEISKMEANIIDNNFDECWLIFDYGNVKHPPY